MIRWFIGPAIIASIIGSAVLLGGYLPNRLFNDRIQQRTCSVYCGVRSYWCRRGAISQMCYDVMRNVQPNNVQCWAAPKIATFTNQQQANDYAARCAVYSFQCSWDPKNPCTWYDGSADVVGTLWAGVAFMITGAVFVLATIGWKCYCGRTGYDQI